MTRFYPDLIINEVNSFLQGDFVQQCRVILRTESSDLDDLLIKILRKPHHHFKTLADILSRYIGEQLTAADDNFVGLQLAQIKLLKIKVDKAITEAGDHVIRKLRNEVGDRGSINYVHEETGEVLTAVTGEDGHLYYFDFDHVSYCNSVYLVLCLKAINQEIEKNALLFSKNFDLQARNSGLIKDGIENEETAKETIYPLTQRIMWDENIEPFEQYFSAYIDNGKITLLNGVRDKRRVLEVLNTLFHVGKFGGEAKKLQHVRERIPVNPRIGQLLPDRLKWNGLTSEFAELFKTLILVDTNNKRALPGTTLFMNMRETGTREPIVRSLRQAFYISTKNGKKEVEQSALSMAFKKSVH